MSSGSTEVSNSAAAAAGTFDFAISAVELVSIVSIVESVATWVLAINASHHTDFEGLVFEMPLLEYSAIEWTPLEVQVLLYLQM